MTGAMSLSNLETRQTIQNSPPMDLNGQSTRLRLGLAQHDPEGIKARLMSRDVPNTYNQNGNDLSVSLHHHFDQLLPPPNLYSHNVHQVVQQPQVYPIMLGPQSFSSYYHTSGMGVAPQGDLGYALQRPGVVPGSSMGTIQQINHAIQLHQNHHHQQQSQSHITQGSVGNHVHATSYMDIGSLPNSYAGVSSMSMSSIHNGSMPQSYVMNNTQSTYHVSLRDVQSQNNYYQIDRKDQQPYYSYRGSSM